METLTNYQIITNKGKPEFIVIPYADAVKKFKLLEEDESILTYPHEVIEKNVIEDKSIVRSWREYKNLTQNQIAEKLGITQSAYSQIEKKEAKLKQQTLDKLSKVLNVDQKLLIED